MTCARGCCDTQADHYRSISISANALPTRRGDAARANRKEKELAQDRDAYKRLRNDGLQPKHIDGSHRLEAKVTSQFDIDLGHIIPKAEQSRVQEGFALAKEMGMNAA